MGYPIYQQGAFDASGTLPQQGDAERAWRMFVGLAGLYLGDDQTAAGSDGLIYNPTGQFQIASPNGSVSVVGKPISNLQGGGTSGTTLTPGTVSISPAMLLLIAAGLYLALK